MLSEAEQAELEALLRPLELPLEPLALLLDDDALALAPAPLLPPLASQLARAPESDESAASASAEAPTSALVHSGPRPARRASYKAQIAQARARASELERELEAARARASSRRQQQQQEMEKQQQEEEMEQQGEERLARKPRATGVWRTIAGRQARYREEAEAENAHLRKLVAAQARHLRNVVALAKRRPYRVEIDSQIRLYKGERIARETPFGHDRDDAFEFLLRRMSPEFAQVEGVRARLRLQEPPAQGRKVLSTRESSLQHRMFEAVSWMTVPFPVREVERTLFAHLAKPRLAHPSDEYSKLVGLRGDTLQLLLATHNHEFNLKQTFCSVTRKFVQKDRTVVVTLALTEPRSSADAAPLGIKALTTIVRILRPGELLSTGEQSTSIESHWSLRGLATDAVSECDAQVFEPFADAGLTHMLFCMTREEEAVEEILLAGGHC